MTPTPGEGSSQRPGAPARPAVVHVSTVHRASDVRIFGKQCRTLAAAGYDVTLLARAERAERVDGVAVCPVAEPGSRAARMSVGVWRLLRPLHRRRAALYHLHDPELIPLGLALRALGHAVVYDAHEDLPAQILEKPWVPAPARPAVVAFSRALVRLAGRGLSAVVAATPTIAAGYAGAARVVPVGNYPIVPEAGSPAFGLTYSERPVALAYVGGIAENRGLATMLRAARTVHGRTGAPLVLAGPAQPAALAERISAAGEAVEYRGVLTPDDARQLMARSRVGLLLYRRSRAHEDAMPNKLFEYMAAGMPVVASDFPLWRQLVAETGAGVVVDPDDADAVARAVLGLLDDPAAAAAMGERGRRAVCERFSWDAEAATLVRLYADLAGAPGPAAPPAAPVLPGEDPPGRRQVRVG